MVAGRGFEPLKAEPADLQSAPIGRSGNPPLAIEQGSHRVDGQMANDTWAKTYALGGHNKMHL